MAFIEGIGDEVVMVVGTFIAIVCITLAWFSTRVRDRPRPEVVVLDRSRIVRALQRIRTATTNTLTQTPVGYVIRSSNSSGSAASTDGGETSQPSDTNSADGNEQVSVLYAEVRGNQVNQTSVSETNTSTTPSPSTSQSETTVPEVVHDVEADRVSTPTSASDSEVRQRNISTERTAPEPRETTPAAASDQDTSDIPESERLDGHIRVRLKYLDERQRLVQARPDSTIEQFKR